MATMLQLLMAQLQSFSRVAIILLTAPPGLIGVVPALPVFEVPSGFVALTSGESRSARLPTFSWLFRKSQARLTPQCDVRKTAPAHTWRIDLYACRRGL